MESGYLGTESDMAGLDSPAFSLLDLCRRLTEDSPLPTVAVEGSSHIVRYANPAFCRLAETDQGELVGRAFAEAVPEAEGNGCVRLLDRVFGSGDAQNLLEQEHRHAGSQPSFWSYAVWAVLNETQRPLGVMLQVTDATEAVLFRRQATAMNEELLLSGVRQHELADVAQGLNARLRLAEKEIHHRVKNNLQVLSALVELQVDTDKPTVPTSAMTRIALHVRTLATLHDMLAKRTNSPSGAETISTQAALEALVALLEPVIGSRRIECRIAPLTLPIGQLASLSLLVSELVSNAVKHADGAIDVALERKTDTVRLTVCDNGSGFPPDFDPRTSANIGLELIMSMARHDLRGEVEFTNRAEGGACVVITFPTERDDIH